MMISPEVYYEMFLKGKSEQDLIKEMKSLKSQIGQLKYYLEKHPDEPEVMYPTRLTRMKCNREYYERAKQVYEESYGKYVPPIWERISINFDKALDSVQSLVFSVHSFPGYYVTWTYTVTGNTVKMEVENHSVQSGSHRKRVLYKNPHLHSGADNWLNHCVFYSSHLCISLFLANISPN